MVHFPCKLTNLHVESSRDPDSRRPHWSLSDHVTVLRIFCLSLVPYPLNHVVVHGEESHLDCWVTEVGNEGGGDDEECDDPVGGGWRQSLDEHRVCSRRYGGRNGSINDQKQVPYGDASPDEDVLYQGEVGDVQSHLAVDDPNYTGVHDGAEYLKADHLTTSTEGLVLRSTPTQEEDDVGVAEAEEHPAEDPRPAEENILYTFLVKHGELVVCVNVIISFSFRALSDELDNVENLITFKQNLAETSWSKTPRAITGREVKMTLYKDKNQSL